METRPLGLIGYEDALKLQHELVEKRADGTIPDTLLLLEHPSVITLGRKSPEVKAMAEIPQAISGVPVFLAERGGEVTFHGPGQLVAYPIFKVAEKLGPKGFLRLLENALIAVLAKYKLSAYVIEGKTGVWLKDKNETERKIASLGIAVRRGVSYHGLALNVSTDLKYFSLVQPCGFAPSVMTSLQEFLGADTPSIQNVGAALAIELQKVAA